MELTVIVPVRDEAGNLRPLMEEIHAALDGVMDYEVVFIDDGSRDGSRAEITAMVKTDPRVRLLVHEKGSGKTRALINGIKAARGPVIVTIDGDRQDDPQDIPKFWAKMTAGGEPDLNLALSGWRTKRKDSKWKWFISRIANRIRAWLLGDNTPDSGCGFKMFPRDAFLELPRFDNMHRFLPALFKKYGCRLDVQEVNHRPRAEGRSKYGTLDRAWASFWDLMGVIWLQRRTRYPKASEEE
jgi:dolichol-phosphate mannosyltransferase